MSYFYADTSALFKRYVPEVGSAWVRGWTDPLQGHVVIICDITPIEASATFARLVREQLLDEARKTQLENIFMLHVEREYLVIPMDGLISAKAQELVSRHPLRALDAIQLASALHAQQTLNEPITFVTSDKVLKRVAPVEGFTVDDPNEHP